MDYMNNSNPPQTARVSDIISTFRACRRFKPDDQKTHVTSLDFDDTGELAMVSRNDDTLQIYNCKEGKHAKELKSQKYGVHLARFTHHAQSVLYASTKVDDTIRYLSSHDNSYIRYYKGHTSTVTCITMSPSSDDFLSCAADNTVRLWNLSSGSARGQLNLHGAYLAAYDPSATVIAIASPPTQSILLYDLRNFTSPPFSTFDMSEYEKRYLPQTAGRGWTSLAFSNDGKSLVVGTSGQGHYVLDAFEGSLKHFCVRRSGGQSLRNAPGESDPSKPAGQGDVSISPDGRYLVGGSGREDGLLVWDLHSTSTGDKVLRHCAELPVPESCQGRVELTGYNPKMNLMCSADKEFLIWMPDPELAPSLK